MSARSTADPIAAPTPGDPRDLDLAIRARLAQARGAWPGLSLSDDEFVRHALGKLGTGGRPRQEADDVPGDAAKSGDPKADLERLRVPELLLACACAHRDPVAIAHFERAYFGEVDAAVRRFDSLPLTVEDVRQRVREKLYLHDPPALAGYAGHGDLGGWLRAAVLHMLINVATRETRERATGGAFFDAIVDDSPDAEAAYLKQACRDEFEQAFTAALARLAPRDKLLLRYAFADGQSVDEVGTIFRVHRATAARWIAKARDQLVEETRAQLMASLRIGEGEAASIVRAALSRMGTTLLRRLG